MPIPQKVIKFLDASKIKYDPIEHRTVFTAYDKAQTLKVPQKIIGKTLVVKFNKSFGLALIPANKNLDKGKLKSAFAKAKACKKVKPLKRVDLVKEAWIKKNLKGVKIGAIPPFGTLWKFPTFVDRSLMNQSEIVVNGGDWNWSIKFNPVNFKKLMPDLIIGSFSKKR